MFQTNSWDCLPPNKKLALKELNNKYNELINTNDGGVENFAKSYQKNESLVGLYELFNWKEEATLTIWFQLPDKPLHAS